MREMRQKLNETGRVRLVRNNVGFDPENRVRYGLGNGSPDLVGTLRGGRCFCIETKTPKGRLSADQQAWWRAATRWGVLGGVARSVGEAMQLLEEAERAQ